MVVWALDPLPVFLHALVWSHLYFVLPQQPFVRVRSPTFRLVYRVMVALVIMYAFDEQLTFHQREGLEVLTQWHSAQ